MDKTYVVYRYVSPSGKSYIGQTCQEVDARAGKDGLGYRSCPVFYAAIQHYGWGCIRASRQILEEGLSHEEADVKEQFYINFYKSLAPNGYNVQVGGTYNTRELFIKPVVGINCFTKEQRIYDSITEAKQDLDIKSTKISAIALHRANYRTVGGYTWIFLSEYNNMTEEEKQELFDIVPPFHSRSWSKYYDIVRLNDGKRYPDLKSAAADNRVYSSNITKNLKGQIHTCGKMPDGTPIKWARLKKERVV